jgi:hypothetical protein
MPRDAFTFVAKFLPLRLSRLCGARRFDSCPIVEEVFGADTTEARKTQRSPSNAVSQVLIGKCSLPRD